MRSCPTCGNHNEDRFNFCGSCGTRIANACPECHFENLLTQPFCGQCGKQLIQEAFLTPSPPEPDSHKPESYTPEAGPLPKAVIQGGPPGMGESDKPLPDKTIIEQSLQRAIASANPPESLRPVQLPEQTSQASEQVAEEHYPDYIPDADSQSPPLAAAPTLEASASAVLSDQLTGPVIGQDQLGDAFPYQPPVYGQHRSIRQAIFSYDQMLANLQNDFKSFINKGDQATGQVLVLSASDGLGKTNLIQEARELADPTPLEGGGEQRLLWFNTQHYRCFSPNRILLQGWVELLQNLIGLTFEGSTQETTRQYIAEFIESLYSGNHQASADQIQPHPGMENFLRDLFGVNPTRPLDTEAISRDGVFVEMMGEILRRLAAIRPLALLLEDIQFADVATLEVLTQLLDRRLLQQAPILLIITHSRDFYPTGALEQALQQVPYKEYVISDFNDAQVETYLNNGPLGGQIQNFPLPILTALIEHAHGLPIFLEELLRFFYLNGIVTLNSETSKFVPGDVDKLNTLLIPTTLSDILQARLSGLSPKTRYILQLASVLGERFSISMLFMLSQDPEAEFNETLNELFNQGLLLPDASNTGRFRHGFIWRSVYNDIEPELKTQLHQLVSQTFENDFSQGSPDTSMTVNLFLMAHHAEQGQLVNRALSYWEVAGVQMAQVGQLCATNHAMFRAIQLIHLLKTQSPDNPQGLDDQEQQLYLKLGMLNSQPNPEFALRLLSRVIHQKRAWGDMDGLLEPYSFLNRCYESMGNTALALASVNESLKLLPKLSFPLEYAALLTTKVGYLCQCGHFEEARQLIENEIEPTFLQHSLEDEPDYLKTYLNARLFLAEILLWQCQPRAFEVLSQSLTLAQEKRLEGLAIAIQLVQARGYLKKGAYQACDEAADRLLSQIEALDEPDWFFAQWGLLAMEYHLAMGDWESARQLMLTVVSRAEGVKDTHSSIIAQLYGSYIAYQFGQADKAKSLLDHAIGVSSTHGYLGCVLQGQLYQAELALSQHDAKSSEHLARQVIDEALLPAIQNRWLAFQALFIRVRALIQNNIAQDNAASQAQLKEAGKLLEKAWPDVIATGYTPLIAEAAALIGELYKNLATQAPSEISKQHLIKSIQFFQKSQGLWLDANNKHQINRLRAAMPGG
ncbi:MAG: zinc ribbon domain-containing protein [Vampirovibrionales bacterium]|nr:zinc ribbon domain-containing protein [Vampirovibrionales bacterium]